MQQLASWQWAHLPHTPPHKGQTPQGLLNIERKSGGSDGGGGGWYGALFYYAKSRLSLFPPARKDKKSNPCSVCNSLFRTLLHKFFLFETAKRDLLIRRDDGRTNWIIYRHSLSCAPEGKSGISNSKPRLGLIEDWATAMVSLILPSWNPSRDFTTNEIYYSRESSSRRSFFCIHNLSVGQMKPE